MKVPITGVAVGLAMWMGLAAGVHAANVLIHVKETTEQMKLLSRSEPQLEHDPQAQQQLPASAPQSPINPVQPAAANIPQRLIIVSIPDHKLALLVDGQVKAVYTVAVGKASTPSPVGDFTIISHVANPTYSHKGRVVGPGPGNPVGTRWMGLSEHGYGIHGTNVPSSIGKSASHGCIRMGRKDLEQLFAAVQPGDSVEIRAHRDAQVTAIFGSDPFPSGDPEPSGPTDGITQIAAAQPVAHGEE